METTKIKDWEYTVMDVKQVRKSLKLKGEAKGYDAGEVILGIFGNEALEAQAQITGDIAYKAGQESVVEPWDREQDTFRAGYMDGYPDGFKGGGKLGRKGVVEWVEEHNHKDKFGNVYLAKSEWQAFKKEMGL